MDSCNNKISSSSGRASFVLLLIIASAAMVAVVPVIEGRTCVEDLGKDCSVGRCEDMCSAKHGKGLGDCDVGDSCKCFYDCDHPDEKTCKLELGLYPQGCAADQCQRDCRNKFLSPEAKDGVLGYCWNQDIYPDKSCRCAYSC